MGFERTIIDLEGALDVSIDGALGTTMLRFVMVQNLKQL